MAIARIGTPSASTAASSTRASSTSRDLPPNQRCEAIVPSRTSPSRKWRSPLSMRLFRSLVIGRVLELEPEEAARPEREQVRQLADLREARVPKQLHRHAAGERGEVELDRLRRPGEVVDAEDDVLGERANVREDFEVLGAEHAVVADAE